MIERTGMKALLPRPEPDPESGIELAAVLLPPEGGRWVALFGGPALELQAAALVDHNAAAKADSRGTNVRYSGRGRCGRDKKTIHNQTRLQGPSLFRMDK